MNRLVLVGNGFDLAHGLPTRYEDFINWYWDQRVEGFRDNQSDLSVDILCEFRISKLQRRTWKEFFSYVSSQYYSKKITGRQVIQNIRSGEYNYNINHTFSPFFKSIIKSIETKGWVDIENEYYNQLTKCTIEGSLNQDALKRLNSQLSFITDLLAYYLESISQKEPLIIEAISDIIYSPISQFDVSIEGRHLVEEFVKERIMTDSYISNKTQKYGIDEQYCQFEIKQAKKDLEKWGCMPYLPEIFMLPDNVMILNFNYTNTADSYNHPPLGYTIHIHGGLNNRDSIIFGYGDELDEKYQQLQALNENECLKNIKSIRYLESDNYRKVLRFLEDAPFQVLIMGHSCGNSDRTLLNTIFEHKNCISIKPYYHISKKDLTDNYLDIVQNISRNFTDMKLMRDRVVNKTNCMPLPQAKPKRTG
jgi:hypothetical protein